VGSDVSQEAQALKCVVCRHGDTRPGVTTFTLERDGAILVVRGVPARVCENCGEEYLEDTDVARLGELAEETAKPGVQVEIRDYRAA
jgi:YgiT-type zinc finger domain-containing protein